MISVVVCDDHQVVRDGLQLLLAESSDIRFVDSCATSAEALRTLSDHDVDVAIIDVRLDELNGIDVIKWITENRPSIRTIVFTAFPSDELVIEAASLGVSAVVDKRLGAAELIENVHKVAAGQNLVTPAAVREAQRRLEAKGLAQLSELGDVDREIVSCIGQGMTDREIAGRVYLSPQTVRNRVSRLLTNLGRENRTQLALMMTEYDDLKHRFPR